jgi:hypothetical protein
MQHLGQAAAETLATIPDTPALTEADRAFSREHPLPLDRTGRLLGAATRDAWAEFSAYWDGADTQSRLGFGNAARGSPDIGQKYQAGVGGLFDPC